MATRESVKHRAVLMGVDTGDMPEVEFIWASQFAEGSVECFGSGRECPNEECHWRHYCQALESYADPNDRAVTPETLLGNNVALRPGGKAGPVGH